MMHRIFRLLVGLGIFLFQQSLWAQNVGISTTAPTAKLHIENALLDSTLLYVDFENELLDPFVSSGDEQGWWVNTNDAYEGSAAAQTGSLGDNDTSLMTLNITIPEAKQGVLTFMLKTDTEEYEDYFIITDNGDILLSESGFHDWHAQSFVLEEGTHTLNWILGLDDNPNNNDQVVSVDSVRVHHISNYSIRIADGLESEGKILTSDPYGNGSWQELVIDEVFDKDDDTGIHVELTEDDDILRMYVEGSQALKIRKGSYGGFVWEPYDKAIAIGVNAGVSHYPIFGNIYIGHESGKTSYATENTFVGQSTGVNAQGSQNTLLGAFSGTELTSGQTNTFLGAYSGNKTEGGDLNTAVGWQSAYRNVSGSSNTSLGSNSASKNILGYKNVSIGANAAFNDTSYQNTMIGAEAGYLHKSGPNNTFIGFEAGRESQNSSNNTFLGAAAGKYTEGSGLVLIGYNAGLNTGVGEESVYIGNEAGYACYGNGNVFLGYESGFYAGNSNYNTLLGTGAGHNLYSSDDNVLIGHQAGISLFYGDQATIVGSKAGLENLAGGVTFLGYKSGLNNTIGIDNTFIGKNSGRTNTEGEKNVFVGNDSGYSNSFGDRNTFVGHLAGFYNSTASDNTFIGQNAGFQNSQASGNTFIGSKSGSVNTGANNSFMGFNSGFTNSSGYENSFLGKDAGYHNTIGFRNTFIGYQAGFETTSGEHNTYIGRWAGLNLTTGDLNTAVGYLALANGTYPLATTCVGADAQITDADIINAMALGNNSRVHSNNSIRVGNTAITYVSAYAGWTDLSDARVKKNVQHDVAGLEFIKQLEPVSYTIDYHQVADMIQEDYAVDETGQWAPQPPRQFLVEGREAKSSVRRSGLIAQDVQALIEDMQIDLNIVHTPVSEEDLYGIDYAGLVVPLIKAVQQQQDIITEQGNRISALEEIVSKLASKTD